MKKILIFGVLLLGIFLIYLSTLDRKIYYLALGDEVSQGYNDFGKVNYNYNDYITEYLNNKNVLETYINSFFSNNMRTIDLINMIEDNEFVEINGKNKTIKNALIKADLVTISIGSNDIISKLLLKDNYTNEEIYNYLNEYLLDLDKLLKMIKQYCKEDVIFIGYYNFFSDDTYDEYFKYLNNKAKELTKIYDINYIDIFDYMDKDLINNNFYPTKKAHMYIGEKIKNIIDNQIFN